MLQSPAWEQHGVYYVLLAIGLAIVWLLAMLCTYSSRCLRRCIYTLGLSGLTLLCALVSWHYAVRFAAAFGESATPAAANTTTDGGTVDTNSAANASASSVVASSLGAFLAAAVVDWPTTPNATFDADALRSSDIWLAAVVQVIASAGIGVGVWPVLTGKFLYKGDAVRTTLVYVCFNVCVCTLATMLFATQYAAGGTPTVLPDLVPLTAVYDAAVVVAAAAEAAPEAAVSDARLVRWTE